MPTAPPLSGYLPRDFVETAEGLVFAVVDPYLDAGRVPCFLRYRRLDGGWVKLDTAAANAWLQAVAPQYRYHSRRLDAELHGLPLSAICRHHQPRQRLAALCAAARVDPIEAKARRCLGLLQAGGVSPDQIGLTGSLLIEAQRPDSDLDFVLYGRDAFEGARAAVRAAITAGQLDDLTPEAWRDAYARRGCALSFDEYLWHERRKGNKGLCDGTKFDLTLVAEPLPEPAGPCRKRGPVRVCATVNEARYAFDVPARYGLDHPDIDEVLSFTQTYAGQARAGERVEIAGQLELTAAGRQRIVIGATREAHGEYLKVLPHA